MPNILDASGLQTATRAELVAYFTARYQDIYGADITLASDTPDGQMMNIFIQSVLDLQDLLTQVYNMQDPDNAIGVILDQRVAINGIQRQAGTYTVTNVTVVNSQSVNLYGLDQTTQPVYTVADNAGNRWVLMTTQLGLVAGSHVLSFRAAVPGAQLTTPNTITVQVTIVLGITSVNNPTTYSSLGVNEESDGALKVRRQQSVSLASQGYLAGLFAALENTTGVTSAFIYENRTDTTDGDGIPGHSVWVIVAGSATPADIAHAIYTKRNAGCGMFGATVYNVTQVDGSLFPVQWDAVAAEALFIAFTASSLNGTTAPNLAAIRAGLVTIFTPGVNAEVNINELATLVQEIDPNTLVTAAGFTKARVQTATLSGTAVSGSFEVVYAGNASAAINWNDSTATVQSKVRALTGLSAAVVTGSFAGDSFTFDLTACHSVDSLITVISNTLQAAGPTPITFTFHEGYANVLTPSAKKNQFAVSAANIVILPMILSPTASTVATGGAVQFAGLGGYGAYAYAFAANNSGGTLNATTGAYVAGGTPSVVDTVTVTDAFGNTATATVSVT